MITDTDIKKMKKVFVTKKDSKKTDKKIDLIADRLANHEKEEVNNFKTILEVIQKLSEKIDASLDELKANRVVLGNHEKRIQNIEVKVFPSTSSQ